MPTKFDSLEKFTIKYKQTKSKKHWKGVRHPTQYKPKIKIKTLK